MHTAFAALGSNLEDRALMLRVARRAIEAIPSTSVTGASEVYETEPVGPIEQGAFLNAVLRLETPLEPELLLKVLHTIEDNAGRQRSEKWGPRTLDLDLVAFEDRVIDVEGLTLPHPRMAERRFVLQPLCDIDPVWRHPVSNRSIRELLDDAPPLDMRRVDVEGW